MSGYNKNGGKVGRPKIKEGANTVYAGLKYSDDEENQVLLIASRLKAMGINTNRSEILREMVCFGLKSKAKIIAALKQKVLCRKGA